MDPTEPLPPQRAADADRDAAADTVRAAGADGRLSFDEMEHRLSAVFGARTHPELDALMADLQGREALSVRPGPPGRGYPGSAPETRRTVTVMGENRRRGFWRPAADSRVLTIMGETTIDLTDAELEPHTSLRVLTLMGATEIIVPEGVNVHVTKVTIMAEHSVDLPGGAIPGAPELHIRLISVMGRASLALRRRERHAELYA